MESERLKNCLWARVGGVHICAMQSSSGCRSLSWVADRGDCLQLLLCSRRGSLLLQR